MKNKTLLSLPLVFGLAFLLLSSSPFSPEDTSQAKKPLVLTAAFYNVENLFDTEDNPYTNDNEFLPGGSYNWTDEHYAVKLKNLARAISQIGGEEGPDILGLSEVENRGVLEDLIQTGELKRRGYEIVHYDSPDQRGIDCALIYKSKVFQPLYSKTFKVDFPENKDITTRDILMVKGLIDKKVELTVFVNHWPSRYGGKDKSDWKRERVASVLRSKLDSIFNLNPDVNLLVMGDFNDEPKDKSLHSVLKAATKPEFSKLGKLYNPMLRVQDEEKAGTLMYRKEWNLFDMVMVSEAMIRDNATLRYVSGSATAFRPEWMRVPEGDWKGAPKRSHIRRKFYEDGFSDHYPVYLKIEYQR